MTVRTVRLCPYRLSEGELPVYEGMAGPVFYFHEDAWYQVKSDTGRVCLPNNELWGDSKYEVISQFLDTLRCAPQDATDFFVPVRSFYKLLGSDGPVWILDFFEMGLLGRQIGEAANPGLLGLPDAFELGSDHAPELDELLIESVIES